MSGRFVGACRKGLHDLGQGCFAWLQPDGGWGWSNAGLVVGGERALLVDTLFDKRTTRSMLDAMRRDVPAARAIETVVNTHANGDHCWGNELVADSAIIASRRAALEMAATPPSKVAMLLRVARLLTASGLVGRGLGRLAGAVGARQLADLAAAGPFVQEIFGAFDFGSVRLTLPDRVFEGRLDVEVGGRAVELHEVGPAHTQGDVIAFVPDARTVYTGDILFIGGHPIVWEGPVANWIAACDRILAADVETVVPGHGPITDKDGVRQVKAYLEHLYREARRRFEAGMSAWDAARDIALDGFSHWREGERVVVNVQTIYRELRGDPEPPDVVAAFALMARYRRLRPGSVP